MTTTVDQVERLKGHGCMLGRVVGKFKDRQLPVSVLVTLAAVRSVEFGERLIQSFHLPIALIVITGRVKQFGAHQLKQLFPEH